MRLKHCMNKHTIEKYSALIAAIHQISCMGCVYAFPLYSDFIATNLGYSPKVLSYISLIQVFGSILGLIMMSFVQDYWGPTINAILSNTQLSLGASLLYLANLKLIPYHYLLVATFISIINSGAMGGCSCCMTTNLANFEKEKRGMVVGILIFSYAIGSFLLSMIYQFVFNSKVLDLMLFLTIWPLITLVPTLICIRPLNKNKQQDHSEITKSKDSTPSRLSLFGNVKYTNTLRRLDFWLIIIFSFLVTANGYCLIATIGSIKTSFDAAWNIATYVSVFTLTSAFTKIFTGISCDLTKKYFPNVVYLIPFGLIMSLGFLTCAIKLNTITLLIMSITTSIAYGGLYTIIPITVNYYYGDKYYSINFSIVSSPLFVFGSAISTIFGVVADYYKKFNPPQAPTTQCYGVECFRYQFVYAFISSILGIGVAIIIYLKEKRVTN